MSSEREFLAMALPRMARLSKYLYREVEPRLRRKAASHDSDTGSNKDSPEVALPFVEDAVPLEAERPATKKRKTPKPPVEAPTTEQIETSLAREAALAHHAAEDFEAAMDAVAFATAKAREAALAHNEAVVNADASDAALNARANAYEAAQSQIAAAEFAAKSIQAAIARAKEREAKWHAPAIPLETATSKFVMPTKGLLASAASSSSSSSIAKSSNEKPPATRKCQAR